MLSVLCLLLLISNIICFSFWQDWKAEARSWKEFHLDDIRELTTAYDNAWRHAHLAYLWKKMARSYRYQLIHRTGYLYRNWNNRTPWPIHITRREDK